MRRRFSYLVLAIMAALALAACGGTSGWSSTRSGAFNNADVTFAQSMIPHHEQAIVMAKMARQHAASPKIKQLADQIEAAQGPEIKTMSGWLEDWGKEVPSDSMSGMSGMNQSTGDMPGMMSDGDMKKLDAATGPAFDRMFLTMMIGHHAGAIDMAKIEQKDGKNSDAVALAKRVEAAQTAEIARMRKMLAA